jgi:hypothetical protein
MLIVLLVAVLLVAGATLASTAKADGPWGYGHGYAKVFPGSGYNKVCMYSAWNCSFRFVPPYPVSGYYKYPYNTYIAPKKDYGHYKKDYGYDKKGHYDPNRCRPGLLCAQPYGGYNSW